jgi:quinolinate synthase
MVSLGTSLAPAARFVGKTPLAFAWSPALEAEMAPLYARVKHIITPMEWPHYAPLIKSINALKAQRNAVILAHNYMTPEIFHCVADFRGDSLQLAKEAARTNAKVIARAARSLRRSRPKTFACFARPIRACRS